MLKKILSLVLIISFLSVGFCFAFDKDSIKGIWENCIVKITEWWNIFLVWINNDMKPWINSKFGIKAGQEFEKEFNEAVQEIPVTIKAIWNKVKEII